MKVDIVSPLTPAKAAQRVGSHFEGPAPGPLYRPFWRAYKMWSKGWPFFGQASLALFGRFEGSRVTIIAIGLWPDTAPLGTMDFHGYIKQEGEGSRLVGSIGESQLPLLAFFGLWLGFLGLVGVAVVVPAITTGTVGADGLFVLAWLVGMMAMGAYGFRHYWLASHAFARRFMAALEDALATGQ
jgi:hypothetical protein